MTLLLFELRAAPSRTLVVPFPKHDALASRCRQFLERPSADQTIDHWAEELVMSRRSFTRLFRRETGLSFAEWRRQAAVLQAIHRIAAGDAITTIALDLGYSGPAAFTSMFKRLMGAPPSQHASMSTQKEGEDE
jgi:AraC-like DNA-binding protein